MPGFGNARQHMVDEQRLRASVPLPLHDEICFSSGNGENNVSALQVRVLSLSFVQNWYNKASLIARLTQRADDRLEHIGINDSQRLQRLARPLQLTRTLHSSLSKILQTFD